MGNSRDAVNRRNNLQETLYSLMNQGLFPYSQKDLVQTVIKTVDLLEMSSKDSIKEIVSFGGNLPSVKYSNSTYHFDFDEQVQIISDEINGLSNSGSIRINNIIDDK